MAVNIALLNPRYPYEKDQVFLGGSISSIGARLLAMGHEVDVVDLNMDRIADNRTQEALKRADCIGVSLIGSPYIPGMLELIDQLRARGVSVPILLGGQVIARLEPGQFSRIVAERSSVAQIRDDHDLAISLGCSVTDIPSEQGVSFIPLWERMGKERMVRYLRHEAALIVSQGCKKRCSFCAASKGREETFREIGVFERDLRYLADMAQRNGLQTLEFYASNLDFFQNPLVVALYLRILSAVRNNSGVDIRVRCLSCMDSFIHATEMVPNLGKLLADAGLYWIGFGVDGADPGIWKSQHKAFNKKEDIARCLVLCQEYGVLGEILMIMGFPNDNAVTLMKSVGACLMSVLRRRNVRVRPYMEKPVVPGNDMWAKGGEMVEKIVANPQLFHNLDFAAIGSPFTHPRTLHRWMCNAAYLLIWAILWPFGRCNTSPLLPQGQSGLYGRIARWVNHIMPFDR